MTPKPRTNRNRSSPAGQGVRSPGASNGFSQARQSSPISSEVHVLKSQNTDIATARDGEASTQTQVGTTLSNMADAFTMKDAKSPKSKNAFAPEESLLMTPIDTLSNDVSRTYRHVHVVLVLATFLSRWSSTVAGPVQSLAELLLPLCLFQALYMIICLPTGSSDRPVQSTQQVSSPKAAQQSQPLRKRPKQVSVWGFLRPRILPSALSTLLALFAATPVLVVLLVLHGAPITTHLEHTTLAGAHFAILAAAPLFYAHGVSSDKWQDIVSFAAPLDEVVGAAVGTLLGAWLGAIPIPLDWDREWQKWPVTIVAGAYGGWAVGKVVGGTWLKGRRIDFEGRDVQHPTQGFTTPKQKNDTAMTTSHSPSTPTFRKLIEPTMQPPPTQIHRLYNLFFLTIEPLSALLGAYYASLHQQSYLHLTHPDPASASASATPPPAVRIALHQLSNLYLFFALNEALVLRSTSDLRVWRTLLACLLVADAGHLASVAAVGLGVYVDWRGWNAMYWGNVGFVYLGAGMRVLFLCGVGVAGYGEGKGKAE